MLATSSESSDHPQPRPPESPLIPRVGAASIAKAQTSILTGEEDRKSIWWRKLRPRSKLPVNLKAKYILYYGFPLIIEEIQEAAARLGQECSEETLDDFASHLEHAWGIAGIYTGINLPRERTFIVTALRSTVVYKYPRQEQLESIPVIRELFCIPPEVQPMWYYDPYCDGADWYLH